MKNDLDTLLVIIDHINKDPDPDQKKRLWSLIGLLSKKEIEKSGEVRQEYILSDLHEYNYGIYVRFQAYEFYRNFPITKIKNSLIDDFIEMEHERRRDNFILFSLAVYQQIEGITNHLFTTGNLWERAYNDRSIQMFSFTHRDKKGQRFGYTLGKSICYVKNGDDIEKTINTYFLKSIDKITFKDKFKIVLYYHYFDTIVKSTDEWEALCKTADNIYTARNQSHRGILQNENLDEKLKIINKYKYQNYLLFSGFLADFTQRIAEHIH
jgi:hypothetical protein